MMTIDDGKASFSVGVEWRCSLGLAVVLTKWSDACIPHIIFIPQKACPIITGPATFVKRSKLSTEYLTYSWSALKGSVR